MSKMNGRLIAGASLIALLAAAPFGLDIAVTSAVKARLEAAGLKADTIKVSIAGVEIDGIARDGVRIGRVLTPSPVSLFLPAFVQPAFAQAGGYTIDNLSLSLKSGKIDVPKIIVSGANVGQEELGRLFVLDKGLTERLRNLNVRSISAPEVRISASFPEAEQVNYTLRNVAADDIVNGRVARLAVGSTTFTMEGKSTAQNGEVKLSEVLGLNLSQCAHVYLDVAGADEKPAALYDSYVTEGMTSYIRSRSDEVNMEIGRLSSNGLRARALQNRSLEAAVGEMLASAKARSDDAERKPLKKEEESKETLKLFGAARDMFNAFEDDGFAAQNVKIAIGNKKSPVGSGSIAAINGTYGNATRSASMKMTGIQMTGPDMTGKLDEYSVEGFSYAPIFEAIGKAIESGDTDLEEIDPRTLIPKLGTMLVRGLEVDAPEPNAPRGVKPERILVKLASFSTSVNDQINGIPTKLAVALDNFSVKLPQNSADDGIKMLKSLGYSAIDISSRLGMSWNEAAREVTLSEFSLGGVDMGKARVSAVFGNISRDVFAGDKTTAQIALMGATARSLNLQIDNAGLAERSLAYQARIQNTKPDEIRRELGTAAAMGIPAVLGPSDEAKAIAGAVAKFISRPNTLKIDLKARNAGGIGLPDIATVGTPDKALKLVTVNASAE